jgi:hypothetical protein
MIKNRFFTTAFFTGECAMGRDKRRAAMETGSTIHPMQKKNKHAIVYYYTPPEEYVG